ncbi:MAG: putative toxin-antitoxin system toxin component, PIN family [Candidatus Hydrogenedentes bacterium]|nr:putative toxin-antitoxin system toxin component, PIN family [Candidatus Hydrogenedentota bacterium]
MRVILDTNVFVSGVFFSGPPYEILDAWRGGRLTMVMSPEILAEYERVGLDLAADFPAIDLAPFLELLAMKAEFVSAPPLPAQVCSDPDDDKFLACALASHTKVITSGDKALLKASGYAGIEVLSPREFCDKYLR